MKNHQKGFVIPILLAVIALLVVGGGVYVYENNKVKAPVAEVQTVDQTQNLATSSLGVSSSADTSTGATDADIAAAVFPSKEWSKSSGELPGNKMGVVYRPVGQTGLPILTIDSIQRGNSGNDALVSVVFYGADSATEVKFVHNLKSQPVALDFPDIKLDLESGKTNVPGFGFNADGSFFVTYEVFGNIQKINYAVVGGVIKETSRSSVSAYQSR